MPLKQRLILFEDIISDYEPMFNKQFASELHKLVEYVFGEGNTSYLIENSDKDEELQIWCGNVLNKTISNGYGQSYSFKSQIGINGDDFSGPIKGWLLEPEGCFDDSIIVLTCENNGLIKNPRYVCGLFINPGDLDRLMADL